MPKARLMELTLEACMPMTATNMLILILFKP